MINICRNKHNFVKHNNFDKHNKHLFVATKHVFCLHACDAVITILASGLADLLVCDAVITILASGPADLAVCDAVIMTIRTVPVAIPRQ